jgi:hypothetical protein
VIFRRTSDGIELPLRLCPGQSIFVVFRRSLDKRWVTDVEDERTHRTVAVETHAAGLDIGESGNYTVHFNDGGRENLHIDLPHRIDLNRGWSVRFQPPSGQAFERSFADLHDFARDPAEAVRHFAGVATFTRSVKLTPRQLEGNQCILDLGDVESLAVVRVNGHKVGELWAPPFSVNVRSWVHKGTNTIEIAVTDRWVNRLIGDESLPADAQYAMDGGPMLSGRLAAFPDWYGDAAKMRARRRTSFATWKHFTADSPLVPAGLIGPAQLSFARLWNP